MLLEMSVSTNSQRERATSTLHEASTRRDLASLVRSAAAEAQRLFRLSHSVPEHVQVALLLGKVNAARALQKHAYDIDTNIRLRGSKYCVGLRTSEIYVLEEVFEYRLYDQLEAYVPKPGWNVFDVGANVGIVSMLHAQRGARVYAFEPNPECYRRLLKNVVANGLQAAIFPFNMGLSHQVDVGSMVVSRGGTTGGTVQTGRRGPGRSRISLTTLDAMLDGLGVGQVDLLKIDVEGHEVNVLEGGERTLQATERLILEYHSRSLLRQVEALLDRHGFTIEHRIDYFPEDLSAGQEEVGMIYAAKRSRSRHGPCRAPRGPFGFPVRQTQP